jgi:hypothetical protein
MKREILLARNPSNDRHRNPLELSDTSSENLNQDLKRDRRLTKTGFATTASTYMKENVI